MVQTNDSLDDALSAAGFRVHLSSITFGSDKFQLGASDLVLLVGPNNAGKSATLRELFAGLASNSDQPRLVVREYELERAGSPDGALDFLKSTYPSVHKGGNEYVRVGASLVNRDALVEFFRTPESGKRHLLPLEQVLLRHMSTRERLQSVEAGSIDFGGAALTHPLHYLHESESMRKGLSRWFKRAFGTEIAADLVGGTVIPLYVGEGAELRSGESPLDRDYKQRLRALPRIQEQGDGMLSFAVVLLHAVLGQQHIILVDEPEAFLHPPQARLLGRVLAEEKAKSAQMIVATHSADVLRGAIEGNGGTVRVLRLTRKGSSNHVAELTPEDIKEVWSDPVLRHSNVLDGVFHERVVVCESEGDCRFYAALADALRSDPNHDYLRDVMFVAAGGKGGMAKLVRALVKLDVSVVVAVDFDILQTTGQLAGLVKSFGAQWDPLRDDHKKVKDSVDALGVQTCAIVKEKLRELEAGLQASGADVPAHVRKQLLELLKPSLGWSRAKSAGVAILPKGDIRAAGGRLLDALSKLSIAVLPVGEIEAFVPTELADKNEWVAAVLTRNAATLATSAELEDARKFVRSLIAKPLAGGLVDAPPGEAARAESR